MEHHPMKLRCYCHHHCPQEVVEDGICEVDYGGKCFAAVEEVINTSTGLLEPEFSYGCFSAGDPAFLQCKAHLITHEVPKSIACCDNANFCNEHLKPMYKESNNSTRFGDFNQQSDYFLLQLLLVALVSLVIISFCVVIYIYCKYRAKEKSQKYLHESNSNKSLLLNCSPSVKDPYFSVDQSSGSGSGMPLLVQRTIGRQVVLKQRIGKGRYGDIFLGEWGGTFVAVKSFHSMEEQSWLREKQIYTLALIKHPNILLSMAWDIRSMDSITQMIIVTDYHANGSLYDYLQTRTLTEGEAMKLVLSTVAGICHLHMEVEGKPYKPGIAHRDLKSKNILVKSNGETCIADFGLSVCSVSGEKGVDCIPNVKQGTRRYMSPEVLDDTMKMQWFEAYKQADIYSLGLILWEIGRRCMTDSGSEKFECEDYAIPYHDCVPPDPSFDDMKRVVCAGVRPEIPLRWNKSKLLRELSKIIQECWHMQPPVRLSALRIKKSLTEARDCHTFVQIV